VLVVLVVFAWLAVKLQSASEKSGVWAKIGAKKLVFREPRGSGDSDKVLHDYSKTIRYVDISPAPSSSVAYSVADPGCLSRIPDPKKHGELKKNFYFICFLSFL
jgi:hypothetical protein